MEAIILAGGFGTRLQSVVIDVPKPMAPVGGIPFLEYILKKLSKCGIQKAVLSVGYKWDIIKDYFKDEYSGIKIEYCVEDEPLGTGGAIRKSLLLTQSENVIVFNGDTFFNIDINEIQKIHLNSGFNLTVSLKKMSQIDRYGTVRVNESYIVSFEEKCFKKEGLINGGIYLINRNIFSGLIDDKKFSFEKDFLEKYYLTQQFGFFISDGYFIDIGIPEDFKKAQSEMLSFK